MGRPVVAGGLLVLAALVGISTIGPGGEEVVGPTRGPTAVPSAPTVVAHPSPRAVSRWTWATMELAGYGRGAIVQNLWTIGDRFVAEIENDEGPDGGPAGPLSSVLLTSTDGFEWTPVDLPAPGFTIDTGAVAEGRLWIVGSVEEEGGPGPQLWSTNDGTWRREPEPAGLVDGSGSVRALAYGGACAPGGSCRGAGWVATIASDPALPLEELRVSDDARTWEPVGLGSEARLSVLGVGLQRGRWIAVTTEPQAGADQGPTTAWTSRNRVRWSPTDVPGVEGGGRALAVGDAGLVLVGTEPAGEEPGPRAWLSPDGVEWLELEPQVPTGRIPRAIHHVAATDEGYVAMSGTHGDAWISRDGELWRHLQAFAGDQSTWVGALAAAGDVLLAGGRSAAGRPTFWVGSLQAQLDAP